MVTITAGLSMQFLYKGTHRNIYMQIKPGLKPQETKLHAVQQQRQGNRNVSSGTMQNIEMSEIHISHNLQKK